jgi:hypothetical protein
LNALALINVPVVLVIALLAMASLWDDDHDFEPRVFVPLFGFSIGLMIVWLVFRCREWRMTRRKFYSDDPGWF